MEDSAVSSCKSVLDIVIAHAQSMAADEVALQLGVQRDMSIIADDFEMMKYFLMTGDQQQDPDWVKQVRYLAYDVKDGLESFAYQCQLEKPSRWRIPRILCERRRATLEVKALLARVADQAFASKRSLYSRLVKGSDADHATQAVAEQSGIFLAIAAIDQARRAGAAGADESTVDLLRLIDDGDKDLRVIVVWGTSFHLGETPAVVEAYGDGGCGKGNPKFGCRASVRLSSDSRQDEILRDLVSQLLSADVTRNQCALAELKDQYALAELEEMATKILSETRFLIVIDGLCSIADWEWIKAYFPDMKNGSRIIVSTRQVEIASLCAERHYQVSELRQFAPDQALYLFHYKVKPQADSAQTISDSSTMLVADEIVLGRSQEKSKLVQLIRQANDYPSCMVIPVLGMGGVGKTTLVKSVYEELGSCFQNRAWITVQRPFSVLSSLRSIARQLYGPNAGREIETMGLEETINEITRLLHTGMCLIVLDDLTSTEDWDLIVNYLEKAAVIVVTTREYKLARHCSRDGNVFKVEFLQEKDAFELFKRKVFKEDDEHFSSCSDLMNEADLILKKCGGLPLAISVIGSFLSDKPKTKNEWRKLNSKLGISEPLQTMRTILFRSYNDLPYHLKSCFLYMAIFPEDYNIKRKRLIRLWVAEGYSRKMQHLTAEEVGDKYFAELLDRSMIMPAKKVTHSTGKIFSCVLHDHIREICVSESMKEELVFTLEDGCLSNKKSKVRQLAISSNWKRDKYEFERILDLSHVRSLTVFGEWMPFFITDTMKFVRVLDLEDASGLKDHHLNQICQLVHLKYLSLRGCKDIFKMPESLGNLRQLHTMDIRGTYIFQLPSSFNKLRKLQQLHASAWFKDEHKVGHSISNERRVTENLKKRDKLKLSFSYNKNFHFLGCNRNASCVVQVPTGIGKLNALRTLGYVRFGHGKGNASVKELKGLTQLRKLELHGVDRTNCRDFWSAIAGHNHLLSLSVNRDCVADDLDWHLDGSLSPPKFLGNLKLWGRLVKATEWVGQLQYLSKLQLHRSGLKQDAIEAIGKLPNLGILRFWKSSFVEGELKIKRGLFPSLILLDLRELDTVTVVEFEDGGMPKLERLQAAGWSGLDKFLGLGYLKRLKQIELGPEFSEKFMENVEHQKEVHPNKFIVKPKSEQYTMVRDLEDS